MMSLAAGPNERKDITHKSDQRNFTAPSTLPPQLPDPDDSDEYVDPVLQLR